MLKSLDIDVLLTGHQHRQLSGTINNTTFIQTGMNGSHLGVVNIWFELINNKWNIISRESELLSVTNIEASDNILKLNEELESETQKWLDSELGRLSSGDCLITDNLKDRLNKHPMVELINKVQIDASGVDISCTALGNTVKGFKEIITMRDVISTYIYPNTLVVLEVSGKDLVKALEKTAEFFVIVDRKIAINKDFTEPKLELYNYDMYDGINYTIDISKPFGSRISNVTYKNENISLEKRYQVVMNNYRAAGGGKYDMYANAKVIKTVERDMVDIIADYIKMKKVIELGNINNIKIRH